MVGERNPEETASDRIHALRLHAKEEDLIFSETSAAMVMRFLSRDFVHNKRPSIFLVQNGMLRALWQKGPFQIALRFNDDGSIQIVLFYPSPQDHNVRNHWSGITRSPSATQTVKHTVETMGLTWLWDKPTTAPNL